MAGKNILVMHGGGPTAVINASLYGIVQKASSMARSRTSTARMAAPLAS